MFSWYFSRNCWRIQKVWLSHHILLPPTPHHPLLHPFTFHPHILLPPTPHHPLLHPFTFHPHILPTHHLPSLHLPFPAPPSRGKESGHDIDLLLTHHDASTVAILLESLVDHLKQKVCVCVCVCRACAFGT